jgi:hypothetical protein
MTTAKISPSTRRLSEVARHVIIPSGIETTGWPAIEKRAREFGDEFDEWQRGLGQVMLGKRADGIYAATVGGITLSIPRQVAKTFLVGRTVFLLSIEFPGLKSAWTAHRLRTSTNTFKNLQGYAKRPKVAPYIADIRKSHAEQEIVFTNGSVLMFGARENGFGRGIDEIDIEVFDEAGILTEKALEDMVAATNQSRHPHGALLFYMGTPPRPIDPGEVFTARRKEALELRPSDAPFGEPVIGEDAVYVECSAEPDADPEDRAQWAVANPSFPHRTPLRSMLRLRKNLPSDDSWKREALGIWDPDEGDSVISYEMWMALGDADSSALDETVKLAIDAPLGVKSATFSIAGKRADGLLHVSRRLYLPPQRQLKEGEEFDPRVHRPLSERVVDYASQLTAGHKTSLILPPLSHARAWKADLIAANVSLDEMTPAEYAEARGRITNAIAEGTIRHRNQPEMNNAVAGLVSKPSGDGEVWSARKSAASIVPLVAATCALVRVPSHASTGLFVAVT